ncbi:MAG: hypothetical protein ACRD0L_07005 [Acidimicrobiales bacterium]
MAKGPIEVSVPDRRRALAAGRLAIVHRPGRLDRVDRARVGVLPVTTPTRTVIDLSACLPVPALERLVDDTLSRRRTSLAKLERRADEILGQGRPGSAALRAVLEGWAPGRPADSLQEMRLVRLLLRHGLPEPVRQHRVCDGDRFVARVDLAWPRARVALELDSAERHAGPRAFHRDRARALRIEAAGWGLYSITPRNIDEGAMTDLVVALRATLGLPAPVRQRPTPIPTVGPSPEAQAGCR